jgi:hypothetical protein
VVVNCHPGPFGLVVSPDMAVTAAGVGRCGEKWGGPRARGAIVRRLGGVEVIGSEVSRVVRVVATCIVALYARAVWATPQVSNPEVRKR